MRRVFANHLGGCATASQQPPLMHIASPLLANSSHLHGVGSIKDLRDGFVRNACSTAVSEDPSSRAFTSKATSLEVEDDSANLDELPTYQRLALRMAGFYSRESQLIRGAEKMYAEVVAQSMNEEIYAALKLEKNFRSQFALTSLHIWLVLARLREEGKDGKQMSQALYDTFWEDMERRVHAEGVKVRVSKWLKELEEYFFGSCVAYDNALKAEESALDAALFRNVYGTQGDKKNAAILTRYLRRELASLAMTDGEAVLKGCIKFSRDY